MSHERNMISPYEVVENMSFSKSPRNADGAPRVVQPPASAPPCPPSPDTTERDPLLPPSYQHGEKGRALDRPRIQHYDNNNERADDPRSFFTGGYVRGDPSLRPNNGQTNVYDDALFGMALHELLGSLQICNIVCSLCSMGLLLITWLFRLITMRIGELVLSCYLALLSFFLLLAELMSLWNIATLDALISENFGLLKRPIGKVCYLVLLTSICLGIGGLPEMIVGTFYFASASTLLYIWCAYAEFRNSFSEPDEDERAEAARSLPIRSVSWSYYSSAVSSFVKSSGYSTIEKQQSNPV